MKVVKIRKSYRSGSNEHFLVLLDEPYTNEDIEYLVEDWCDSDPSGSNYGYDFEWHFVEDQSIIKNILKDKIRILEGKINRLKLEKSKMEKYL